MKSISRTYPTPELRFYRRANGKAILQQRWCTEGSYEADSAQEAVDLQRFVIPAIRPDYFWQDVPMVTE
jgi:hypothetical protein